MGARLHWPGVGGLGCQSAGDVTGERGWVLGLTEVGLVVLDVGQLNYHINMESVEKVSFITASAVIKIKW